MPVDLSASIYDQYRRASKKAQAAERSGAYQESAAAYRYAAEMMRQYAEYTHDRGVRSQRIQRAEAHERAAKVLEKRENKIAFQKTDGKPQPDEPVGDDDYEADVLHFITTSNVHWEDVGGLDETKRMIKTAYVKALARKPGGVKVRNLKNILFYGPPGTGKTLLAAATAGSLDATFFNVKISGLVSKYFGESTKLITALYAVARRMSPAVIFLDEFESLTPQRGSGESGAERRIVSTLLAELDGMEGKDSQDFVITMGATNLPWLLDTAILRRFEQRIYIPLPDTEARRQILSIHLEKQGHKTRVSMTELAERTEGFSGSDIGYLCEFAISHMIDRLNDLSPLADKGREAAMDYELVMEAVNQKDFEYAFGKVQPVSTPQMLKRFDDWVNQVKE